MKWIFHILMHDAVSTSRKSSTKNENIWNYEITCRMDMLNWAQMLNVIAMAVVLFWDISNVSNQLLLMLPNW